MTRQRQGRKKQACTLNQFFVVTNMRGPMCGKLLSLCVPVKHHWSETMSGYDFKLWAVTLSPSQKGREQRYVQEQGSRQKWVPAPYILQCNTAWSGFREHPPFRHPRSLNPDWPLNTCQLFVNFDQFSMELSSQSGFRDRQSWHGHYFT